MKIAIVGAGISGATIASLGAKRGHNITVFEKRDTVGGNCSDSIITIDRGDYKTKILKSDFGAHIFHTDDKSVWDFLNSFSPFYNYCLQVQAKTDIGILPLPINLNTINAFFNMVKSDFEEPFDSVDSVSDTFKNSILSRSPKRPALMLGLFQQLIKNYSEKQWGRSIDDIPPSVANRIPTRNTYDNRYFEDQYQGLPYFGYSHLIERMLYHQNIKLIKGVKDLHESSVKDLSKDYDYVFYCGSLDKLFGYKYGELEFRSLKWVDNVVSKNNVQGCAVLNDCTKNEHTRTVEWKHFAKNFDNSGCSLVTTEYPQDYKKGVNQPLYPISDFKNLDLQKKYVNELQNICPNVLPLGRMAQYKYYDMDDAVKEAFKLYDFIINAEKKKEKIERLQK